MTEAPVRVSQSFPKASRFPSLRSQSPDLLFDLGSTFNRRAPSFGYGARTKSLSPYSPDNPPPGAYEPSTLTRRKKGATFMSRHSLKPALTPGPGEYDLSPKRKLGNIAFGVRPVQFPTLSNTPCPTPTTYTPNFDPVSKRRIRNISFGSAKRF